MLLWIAFAAIAAATILLVGGNRQRQRRPRRRADVLAVALIAPLAPTIYLLAVSPTPPPAPTTLEQALNERADAARRLAKTPQDVNAWRRLGDLDLAARRPRAAAHAYASALDLAAENADTDLLVAYAAARLAESEARADNASREALARALAKNPESEAALRLAAVVAIRDGDQDAAQRFLNAIPENPP